MWPFLPQSRPTEAMKETETLQYRALNAKDYIPGAEALKEVPDEEEEGQGEDGEKIRWR